MCACVVDRTSIHLLIQSDLGISVYSSAKIRNPLSPDGNTKTKEADKTEALFETIHKMQEHASAELRLLRGEMCIRDRFIVLLIYSLTV